MSLLYARSIRKELSVTHQAPHLTNESTEELPWKLLANAIIIKAVEDFENNVIFKTATHTGATELNGETAGSAEISADKKSITWTTQVLDNKKGREI